MTHLDTLENQARSIIGIGTARYFVSEVSQLPEADRNRLLALAKARTGELVAKLAADGSHDVAGIVRQALRIVEAAN